MLSVRLQFQLQKSAEAVFTHLSDVNKYAQIHPVIQSIQRTGPMDYLVFEELRFGPLPIRFSYPATVESDPTARIIQMRATVLSICTVHLQFEVAPANEGCLVCEHISVSTWLPIQRLIISVFRTQHTRMFANLEMLSLSK